MKPQEAVRKLLLSEHAYASAMLALCWDQWGHLKDDDGRRFTDWHPSTLRLEIEQTWGVEVPQGNLDRLMAGIAILTTDLFHKNEGAFTHLCTVLSGALFNPEMTALADADECAWGITEALLIRPPDEEDPEPFSDAVRHYIGEVLHREGFVKIPDVLRIALGKNNAEHVRANFSDDPELREDIKRNQEDKAKELTTMIREGLVALVQQVKALPLTNGSANDLEKRLSAALKAAVP